MQHGSDHRTSDEPLRPPEWLESVVEASEGDERLDEIGHRLRRLTEPLREGRVGQLLRGDWLGHAAHPLLTDVPIGFFTSAFVLDLVGGKSSRTAARRLVGLGLVSTVPTVLTGAVDYSRSHSDERVRRVGVVHAVGNTLAAMFYFRSWRSRRDGRHVSGVLLGFVGGALASFSGYLGGHMSFVLGASHERRGESSAAGAPGGGGGARREQDSVVDLTGESAGDLLDIHQAAERLGVSVDDVNTMVEEEVLVPYGGDGTGQFRPGDVEAARMRGG